MGFIREQFGRITVESRRESFMIHVEDASLREPSSEWWTADLGDLIAALTDYRDSLAARDTRAALAGVSAEATPDERMENPAARMLLPVDMPPPNLAVAGSPADEHPGYQLLRVADEVLDKLEREGSEPVHILGVQRHDDGTIDLVCGTVAPAAIFPPGRLDAPLKADAWDEGFAAGWDNGRAAENARIVAALRAKGTHAADVLADQIEREAP